MGASGATAPLAGAGTNPTPGGGTGGSGSSTPAGGGAPANSFGGTISSGAGSAGAPVVGGTSAGGPPLSCTTPQTATSKRLVRLSFNQIASSIGGLIDTMLGSKVAADNQVVDAEHRTFPPLQNPREGNSVTDATWKTIDAMAQAAGQYVFDNFAAVTSCGATPTDDCAQKYLNTLAQKAYRRPLTAGEQTRLTTLYGSLKNDSGATINEAVQHAVYAIVQSPQFVYRTEFGTDSATAGTLTPFEVASTLAYFLTDTLPDAELLGAAAGNQLGTAAQVGAHVDRILKTPSAQKNLHGAMMSYFAYPDLENIVIQDPGFTDGIRNSMYHEGELFLQNVLWSGGKLSELLLSRKAYVNASLASIYGVPFPAPGATLDADMFGPVDLPANRAGLVTQVSFLTTRSRPDSTSVVGRGLLIKKAFLCTDTPPPPESITAAIEEAERVLANASEREKSNYRTSTAPCNGCHLGFDAYGLTLDTYDIIGRYRSTDAQGRAIDPAVTLPAQIGGAMAKDAVEMAQKLVESGAFSKCMGTNLLNYALADVSAGAATLDSCAVDEVAKSFATTDQSFAALVKAVATSTAFVNRSQGAVQ
jgi:hypothetical protein